ncbi:MAG: alpha/beta fold hydrolase [Acidobacteria bacterium]|nr:alpha/beta fold hydrolase [Acidobacteriota bacterium]
MSDKENPEPALKQSRLAAAAHLLDHLDKERAAWWLKLFGLIAAGTAGSLTLLLGAASYPLSGVLIRPKLKRLSQLKSPHLRAFLKRLNVGFEDVLIPSFDNIRLHGWWLEVGTDAPTVVLIHGVKKNRTDVLRAALVLRRNGFNALVFDGRGHGNSEGRYVTYGYYERRDVEAVIDWLVKEKSINKNRVGLAGESMGAAIALQVAAHNEWVKAVWADSPFASLRRVSHEFLQSTTHLPDAVVSPMMWTAKHMANYRGNFDMETIEPALLAAKIQCPVFLIHGTADQLIATEHSQMIYDALTGDKELWIVKGIRHARAARHAKTAYTEKLVRFFTAKLAPTV